jgi:hypothetical protein
MDCLHKLQRRCGALASDADELLEPRKPNAFGARCGDVAFGAVRSL